jgi:hypothetical protein
MFHSASGRWKSGFFRLARPAMSAGARGTRTHRTVRGIEALEARELLTTFTVSNLLSSGPGSLRQAILAADVTSGPSTIDFSVAGTIPAGTTPLPPITAPVTIDGTSAPGFSRAPVVTVDFQGTAGLEVGTTAGGSTIRGLSLVNASTAALTLWGSSITVQDNYIGLEADGRTVAANQGDGIAVTALSHGDLIGSESAVSSVSYFDSSQVGTQPVTAWQGIKPGSTSGQYLIVGTSGSDGLLFEGTIAGVGQSYKVDYPGAATTSVYGVNDSGGGQLELVGSYKNTGTLTDAAAAAVTVHGFLFQGTVADLSNPTHYRTVDYPGAKFTYVHSVMGNFAVGNADGPDPTTGLPLGPGTAFLYNLTTGAMTRIVYPGSVSNTAYGIWDNGHNQYTIIGGYSNDSVGNVDQTQPIGQAMMVDFDANTGRFSHWTTFNYLNGLVGKNFVTHFEGISSLEKGVYTLSADSVQAGSSNPVQGSFVTVRRNPDGSFGPAVWTNLNYPSASGISSSNSVAGNAVVGLVIQPGGDTIAFQATVNQSFQLSNVISGNLGNGIGLYGARGNAIGMNAIGTDSSGTLALGNARNGILVTAGAAGNLIGGQATNGNDPTAGVFARPPQGNLISGNGQDGVLINAGATGNLLSGNFIGTVASGNAPLGNRGDGVAIDGADGNQLIGCTFQQDPFVFYNVISGNGGNGLSIHNANNTVVQANFLGAGANNATVVPNGGDGLLVSGSSANTQVGGVIPLGNVISGNDGNGIEVRDTATGFVSFNTFAGTFAFGGAAPNKANGILVTSTGGNNLIRTCIVGGNLGNGIAIAGDASGVQVTDTGVGLNTSLQYAIPDLGCGIVIAGTAHDNIIGGFQVSIEPHDTISGNGSYGLAILGSANHNVVFGAFIGTNAGGNTPVPNAGGGILLGPGTSANIIGGPSSSYRNVVRDNSGNGITIVGSSNNILMNDDIEGNTGNGVFLFSAAHNAIGLPGAGNRISSNAGAGLLAMGDLAGSQVLGNQLDSNGAFGVLLSAVQGLKLGGTSTGTGNTITGSPTGLFVSSASNGTVVQGNTIRGNLGNGLTLASATGLSVGGRQRGSRNQVTLNRGYGLLAVGRCTRSKVVGNAIVKNTQGNVNLAHSQGLRYVPGRP